MSATENFHADMEARKHSTKRQRKTEAFRQGKRAKKTRNEETKQSTEEEAVAPDLARLMADSGEIFTVRNADAGASPPVRATTKGKSQPDMETAEDTAATKDSRRSTTKTVPSGGQKRRFIVFVGRLPRDITQEELKQYFAAVGSVTAVRLLTEKGTNQPRGCGFVEFAESASLEKALALHQSKLKNKKITVELTVGGGGKGEERQKRIREKNEKLSAERQKQKQKQTQTQKRGPVTRHRNA